MLVHCLIFTKQRNQFEQWREIRKGESRFDGLCLKKCAQNLLLWISPHYIQWGILNLGVQTPMWVKRWFLEVTKSFRKIKLILNDRISDRKLFSTFSASLFFQNSSYQFCMIWKFYFCLMNFFISVIILAFVDSALSQFNFAQESVRFPESSRPKSG